MAWRLAESLDTLKLEIKAYYPKTTIWTIGDKDHQSDWSDHNPNKKGVVCAADILDNGGLNLGDFVAFLVSNPHPNLRYVIYKDKIYERSNNFESDPYGGSYHSHVHVSVGNGPDGRSTYNYDGTQSWDIDELGDAPSNPKPPTTPNQGWTEKLMNDLPELSRGSKGLYVNRHQALLNIAGAGLREDGDFGPATERETEEFQRRYGLVPDGIVGPKTWTKELTWK